MRARLLLVALAVTACGPSRSPRVESPVSAPRASRWGLVFEDNDRRDLVVTDVDGRVVQRLAKVCADDGFHVMRVAPSPVAPQLLYSCGAFAEHAIWLADLGPGAGPPRALMRGAFHLFGWSNDGQRILYWDALAEAEHGEKHLRARRPSDSLNDAANLCCTNLGILSAAGMFGVRYEGSKSIVTALTAGHPPRKLAELDGYAANLGPSADRTELLAAVYPSRDDLSSTGVVAVDWATGKVRELARSTTELGISGAVPGSVIAYEVIGCHRLGCDQTTAPPCRGDRDIVRPLAIPAEGGTPQALVEGDAKAATYAPRRDGGAILVQEWDEIGRRRTYVLHPDKTRSEVADQPSYAEVAEWVRLP